jgi:hypothetical protein
MHFENVWEECEKSHGELTEDVSSIINELILKINFYKAFDFKTESLNEEQQKIKAHAFGELLFSLTKLSYKENVNVYEALSYVLHHRSIEHYSALYSSK